MASRVKYLEFGLNDSTNDRKSYDVLISVASIAIKAPKRGLGSVWIANKGKDAGGSSVQFGGNLGAFTGISVLTLQLHLQNRKRVFPQEELEQFLLLEKFCKFRFGLACSAEVALGEIDPGHAAWLVGQQCLGGFDRTLSATKHASRYYHRNPARACQ